MDSWSEVWSKVERSQPQAVLQRWLDAISSEPSVAHALRSSLGEDSQQHAAQLVDAVEQAARGERAALQQRLTRLGSALAQEGVEYSRLHALATLLRKELRASGPADPALQLAASDAVDAALGVVGEFYVSEQEGRVRAERNNVEMALRSSEMRFTRLFEAGIIGILICDIHGNIKDANEGFLSMVGYSRDEVLTGKVRWAEMTPPEWVKHDEEAVAQLMQRGFTSTWEKEYIRKDGGRVPILVGVAMLNDIECIAFVLDITERRRLEELRVRSAELEAQNERVKESSRLKNEFLANMSHELRTPLNSIIGFADILYDREVPADSPKHYELIGDILRSGRHLLQLINDVLDLAKVEAGKLDFRPEVVDLPQLVSEVAAILRSIAAGKQIEIVTEIDPNLEQVTLDPARLKQVLYNYISNALKFTDNGGRVSVRATLEGEGMFRIAVADTGIGIAPQDLPRLFIEFQQLDAGTAKKHAGTGLGLALTKRIVEAQAGSVGVTSILGRGSTFFAILPIEASGEEGIEPLNVFNSEEANQVTESAAAVLVVEDDARDRRLLSRILSDAGYGVDQAATGAQAVAACVRRKYDAITLDLLLPDITGLEVLHNIREEGENQATPVVIVSVVAEKGVIGGYPVHDYLTKPVNSQELRACMRRARVASQTDRKVWVIDDDPSALKLMETVLTQLGYQVSCEPDPVAALQRLTLEQPSAIVLDLMMPRIDGFEFLARLRDKPEHDTVPVIVWTMKDLSSDDHKRLHRVAQAVLLKGYDRNVSLTQQMRSLLKRAIDAVHGGEML
ncbi:MAG TPA: response regulator [Polyangiales bacterium]|nr:response regulator [Polyangiales bacterium]